MIERRKMYDIFECGYELPIAATYGIYTSENKLITVRTYFKRWFKILLSHQKGGKK